MSTVALVHTKAGEETNTTVIPAKNLDFEVHGENVVFLSGRLEYWFDTDALVTVEIRQESWWRKWLRW